MIRVMACALLVSGCTIPLTADTGLNIGGDGFVRHRANAKEPSWYVGVRLSVVRSPR